MKFLISIVLVSLFSITSSYASNLEEPISIFEELIIEHEVDSNLNTIVLRGDFMCKVLSYYAAGKVVEEGATAEEGRSVAAAVYVACVVYGPIH
jgi:hypothetical protein